MNPRWSVVLLGPALLLATGGLGACAAFAPRFEQPHLSVLGVEVKDASLSGQHFRVRMRVQNPNDRALPVRGISYTMQLAGEDFGEGAAANAFTVPALGEADFDILVSTNLAATLWKVLPRLKDTSQPLEYRLVGRVDTDLMFLRSIPFDERGSVALR
jgi:LEA14-like dessication related protein